MCGCVARASSESSRLVAVVVAVTTLVSYTVATCSSHQLHFCCEDLPLA